MRKCYTALVLFFLSFSSSKSQPDFMHLSINDGLSHSQITSIYKDSRGFMWFGTASGLNRFDGYDFRNYRHHKDSTSLSDSYIYRIFEDHRGNLLISTKYGWNIYDYKNDHFIRNFHSYLSGLGFPPFLFRNVFQDSQDNFWYLNENSQILKYNQQTKQVQEVNNNLFTNGVDNIVMGQDENLWVLTNDGQLINLERNSFSVVSQYDLSTKLPVSILSNYNIYCDSDNEIWFYNSEGNKRGLYLYSPVNDQFHYFHPGNKNQQLNNELVSSVVETNDGSIWVGTDHGGINVIDKKDFSISYILHNDHNEKSLSQNVVTTMYKDNENIIWVGTFKHGVNYYHKELFKFKLFEHDDNNENSLSYNDVNCFAEDNMGNMWIGTNGGGLIYFDRKQNIFSTFKHDKNDPQSLSNDVIVCLLIDHANNLWIGTYNGGLNLYNGKIFKNYKHDPEDPTSLASNHVWEIYEDSQKNLWIGTLGEGLDLFDRERNRFYHYKNGDINSIRSGFISDVMEDIEGNLWVATAEGIDLLQKNTGRFVHFGHELNNELSLSNDNVTDIHQDSRGMIWIATREGLNLFRPESYSFTHFSREEGLPDDFIMAILEDHEKNIWMSTANGLSRMTVEMQDKNFQLQFENYDVIDGLQGREFNDNAALVLNSGELVFGGANGFNLFHPQELKANKQIPNVVLTDFKVFNNSVQVGQKIKDRVILEKTISATKEIVLPHSLNMFSLEFAALNYFHPEKNQYKYKLEGFNQEWLYTNGNSRRAVYTNLDPGEYVFRVQVSSNDGYWNSEGISLVVKILPPFWQTPLAFVLYILIIMLFLWLARWVVLERERLNNKIENERLEANRVHALDIMKIKFFTNISHEFRTPISMILAPIENFLKESQDTSQKKHFELIHRNARRLLTLVNQLMDFRKMEMQELKLNLSNQDIVSFVKESTDSFSDISEKRNVAFHFHCHIKSCTINFDPDKLERILFNLLSNAFKFTPAGGSVVVNLDYESMDQEQQWLKIEIKDTGIGIPSDKLQNIFQRFFQADMPESIVNQGSGIGLSITSEFVKLHHGKILVKSEPGKGSVFTVLLPLADEEVVVASESIQKTIVISDSKPLPTPKLSNGKLPTILIIEDNEDLRFYLKENIQGSCNILEAADGDTGWEMIKNKKPDLIVSDIVMPGLNGLELTKKLKDNAELRSIPIILLTARASEEQKIEGFSAGADEYLVKPFNFEILLYKIRNLLMSNDRKKSKYSIEPSKVKIESADEKFMKKCIAIVEDNISDSDFSVEDFSREVGMSRVSLYKKLLAMSGKTPVEFIRTIRVKRAEQLLLESKLSVSEIAYQVGFNNPKYFSKYFKDEYGLTPSQYAAENKTIELDK